MRFGRKRDTREDAGEGSVDGSTDSGDAATGAETDPRAHGPWDASEVTLEEDDDSRLDLGSLLLRPHPGLEVQLQVDEASGTVLAVVLAGETGAAEVRVFASPRNGSIWDSVRTAMAAEVAQLGGTATESEGVYGPELEVSMMVEVAPGEYVQQPSRVVGIVGPRWLLRLTLFGRPAVEHLHDGDIETAVRDIVVVRGRPPCPPVTRSC